ncbi:MAG TPA: hypothetical protein VFJ82_01320 [Longimicrobium sp.]|nr:hypothetical protein [Longimicrobium sp.]
MSELSNVLQEVLKALGIEAEGRIGLRGAAEGGDHHRRPAAAESGDG